MSDILFRTATICLILIDLGKVNNIRQLVFTKECDKSHSIGLSLSNLSSHIWLTYNLIKRELYDDL